MGLMETIRKWSDRKKEKSAKFKELEEDYKLNKMLADRQKSSNERELEAHMKRLREDDIKRKLDSIHDQQTKDNWKSKPILNSQKSILKNDRPILKEKHIFMNNKSTMLNSGMKKKRLF
jgi:hypothetical protein